MRSKIFLYLFIFTLMFTIFIYVNDKKILDSKDSYIENLEAKLEKADASHQELLSENNSLKYFSLTQNEGAVSYFESQGIDPVQLESILEDEIIGRNTSENDNELVPYAGMEGVMRVNKVKVLNHKWIIADFTDGKYWGELFLSYEVDENRSLQLNTISSFLYPKN